MSSKRLRVRPYSCRTVSRSPSMKPSNVISASGCCCASRRATRMAFPRPACRWSTDRRARAFSRRRWLRCGRVPIPPRNTTSSPPTGAFARARHDRRFLPKPRAEEAGLADGSADLAIQTWIHPWGWLIVPIRIGSIISLDFVLDTAYPITRISHPTRDLLEAFGYLSTPKGRIYRLRGMRVQRQELPELEVRASRPAPGDRGDRFR